MSETLTIRAYNHFSVHELVIITKMPLPIIESADVWSLGKVFTSVTIKIKVSILYTLQHLGPPFTRNR